MRPFPHRLFCLLPGLLCATMATSAQDTHVQTYTAQIEGNVRTEYAEVLRVEPIHVPACPAPPHSASTSHSASRTDAPSVNPDVMLSLKTERTRTSPSPMPPLGTTPQERTDTAQDDTECTPLRNGSDGQQLVYDVDYVLRGVKYRSRLPYDPGNRLQVQLSVTPVLPPEPPKRERPES